MSLISRLRLLSIALALTSVFFAGSALALEDGNADRGKEVAFTCMGCHGIPFYKNVYPSYSVPRIAGQNYGYIVSALQAYRDGQRRHRTMVAQAHSLSDQEIRDVAAFFAAMGEDHSQSMTQDDDA